MLTVKMTGKVPGILLLTLLIQTPPVLAWSNSPPAINSTADVELQTRPFLTLSQDGRPTTLATLGVDNWVMRDEHNRPIAGRSILDPKVYWMLSGKDNANAVFLPFDSANRIVATLPSDFAQYLWGAKAAFSYRTEDGAATGSILMPVVCPNSVAVPSLRECAVPLSMGTHVFFKDIYPKGGGSKLPERGMYFLFDAAQRLSQSLDYYDVNRPIIITAVSTAQGQAIIAAGTERQRKLQEQDTVAKNQAAEQQRLAAEAEIQRGRSTLQAAKKGATLFCASASPVHTGMQTSDVTYRCDLTGEAQWPVRDLLALNWDISNESRTPVDGSSGDASVSLILKKQ